MWFCSRKLTQEEYERQEKEQRLSVADEKAILAVEEVKIYKYSILFLCHDYIRPDTISSVELDTKS